MSTPTLSAFKSAAALLAMAACAACAPQVHERPASAEVFVPCWGDAPPRMRHVDWALSQSGLALNRAARERLLHSAQRICAAGAGHAEFALQPGTNAATDVASAASLDRPVLPTR